MNFKKGQKVVCIDAVFDTTQKNFSSVFSQLPKEWQTYTIRLQDGKRVLLEEVINDDCPFEKSNGQIIIAEPGFDSKRFKDLEELLSEISIEEAEESIRELVWL